METINKDQAIAFLKFLINECSVMIEIQKDIPKEIKDQLIKRQVIYKGIIYLLESREVQ